MISILAFPGLGSLDESIGSRTACSRRTPFWSNSLKSGNGDGLNSVELPRAFQHRRDFDIEQFNPRYHPSEASSRDEAAQAFFGLTYDRIRSEYELFRKQDERYMRRDRRYSLAELLQLEKLAPGPAPVSVHKISLSLAEMPCSISPR